MPDDGGAVVALTSDHTTGNLPYGASQGALDRIVISAARELGPRGISANVVNPGPSTRAGSTTTSARPWSPPTRSDAWGPRALVRGEIRSGQTQPGH